MGHEVTWKPLLSHLFSLLSLYFLLFPRISSIFSYALTLFYVLTPDTLFSAPFSYPQLSYAHFYYPAPPFLTHTFSPHSWHSVSATDRDCTCMVCENIAMVSFLIRDRRMAMNAYLLWIFAVFIVAISAWNGGWREALWSSLFSLAIALIAYACLWQPRLVLNQAGVTVRNIIRTAWIPWSELDDIENRYGLYLHSSRLTHKVPVWALPSRAITLGYAGRKSTEDDAIQLDWDSPAGAYHYTMDIPQACTALDVSRTRMTAPQRRGSSQPSLPQPPHSTLRLNTAALTALAIAVVLVICAVCLAIYLFFS